MQHVKEKSLTLLKLVVKITGDNRKWDRVSNMAIYSMWLSGGALTRALTFQDTRCQKNSCNLWTTARIAKPKTSLFTELISLYFDTKFEKSFFWSYFHWFYGGLRTRAVTPLKLIRSGWNFIFTFRIEFSFKWYENLNIGHLTQNVPFCWHAHNIHLCIIITLLNCDREGNRIFQWLHVCLYSH